MRVLELQGLGRRYGYRRALEDVTLTLDSGELVCLLGPNGAGKSTLLRAIASRSPNEEGSIVFLGDEVGTHADRRRLLAHTSELSHQTGLLADLSAYENLAFFLALYRARESGDREHIEAALERVGLRERARDPVRSFSRGMRQRLALARVFLAKPSLVLLDEPLTGLDADGQRLLFELIAESRQAGTAFLIAIHGEEPFAHLATRFLYLNQGRLVADIPAGRWNETARSKVHALLYGSAESTSRHTH